MMLQTIMIACGTGILSAIMSVAFNFGTGIGLIIAYFALLPLLLLGLSRGFIYALIASIIGAFGLAFTTGFSQGILYSISVAIPACLIIYLALSSSKSDDGSTHWRPIGDVFSSLTIWGCTILIILAITQINSPGGLISSIEVFLNRVIENRIHLSPLSTRQMLIDRLIPLFPALIIFSWMLMTVINSVLAQKVLLKANMNVRPETKYSDITIPEWNYWFLAFAVIFMFIGSGNFEFIVRNIAFILMSPFFLVGLAVVHILTKRFRLSSIVLITFYFLLIISTWIILVSVMIGFFEPWTRLRHKFSRNTNTKNTNN